MRKIALVLTGVALALGLSGQELYKQEVRSAWVASVANIDWPKYEHRGKAAEQQADLIAMLDLYRDLNMNAIFLQVRPECDALYQSAYEPWSRYLTWSQGDDPGYDPLLFAIEEAHLRGIELHAWINPYRINASANPSSGYFDDKHVYMENPEWAIEYSNGKYILNPGLPDVITYIGDVVRDLVSKYDLDGVHFDDYFYSYNGTPDALDQVEFDLYGGGMNRGDWRRDNVNRMVQEVYSVIQDEKPWVRFGVSPFGIYRNGVPSGIAGMDAYSQIYCDPLAWLEDGSVDYLTPQLYWPTGGAQDFETLVNWWSDQLQSYGRHLYPGQGIYRINGKKKNAEKTTGLHEHKEYMNLSYLEQDLAKGTGDPVAPWNNEQIGLQIDLIRANRAKGALGSVFFSAKNLENTAGLAAYLKDNYYLNPPLLPEMDWKTDDTPSAPVSLRIEQGGDESYLRWDHVLADNQRFAVYISDGESSATTIIAEPAYLQGQYFENEAALSELSLSANSYAVVTTVSATGRESNPSTVLPIDVDLPLASLLSPASGDTLASSAILQWGSELSSPQYQLEVATNASFSNVIYTSPWTTQEDLGISSLNLEGETTYYWHVRAREDLTGPFTAGRSFHTGFPVEPSLDAPSNLAQQISTQPTVKWSGTGLAENIRIQVSLSSSFTSLVAEEIHAAGPGEARLETKLERNTWYYLRIGGENSYGSSEFTRYVSFLTTEGEIPEVDLLSPADGATTASFDLLEWSTTATMGSISYQLELGNDEELSGLYYRTDWIGKTDYPVEDLDLEGKRTYYWRVKAKSEYGEGEYSEVRSYFAGYPSRPKMTSPEHFATNVSPVPVLAWTTDVDTDSIYVEFSKHSDFRSLLHSETMPQGEGTGQIGASLPGHSQVYCRIRAANEYGHGVFSALRTFQTGEGNSVEAGSGFTSGLEVSPNPFARGKLHIRYLSKSQGHILLKVLDNTGRTLHERQVSTGNAGAWTSMKLERDIFPGQGLYHLLIIDHQDLKRTAVVIQ